MRRVLKRLIAASFIFTILLSALPLQRANAAGAEGQERIVKIGYMYQPGFMELGVNGTVTGYAAEYLEEICKYTDWRPQYVTAPRQTQLEMLGNGELDIVVAQYSEQNVADYGCSQIPFAVLQSLLYAHTTADARRYQDPSSFDGRRVGVLEGSLNISLLKDFSNIMGVELDIMEYGSSASLSAALALGKVDLIASEQIPKKAGFVPVERFNSVPYHLYTRADDTKLLNEINFILTEIDAVDPQYRPTLYNKHFGEDSIYGKPYFTIEERNYIAAAKPITVALIPGFDPASYHDDEGMATGVLPEIMKTVSKLSGVRFNYVFIPEGTKPTDYLNEHPEHILGGAMLEKSVYNEEQYISSKVIYSANTALAMYKSSSNHLTYVSNSDIGTVTALEGMRSYLEKTYSRCKVSSYATVDEGLTALLEGKVEFFAYPVDALQSRLSNPRYADLAVYNDKLIECSHAIFAHDTKENRLLTGIINKCLSAISSTEVELIKEEHIRLSSYRFQSGDVFYRYRDSLLIIVLTSLLVLGLLVGGILLYRQRFAKLATHQTERDLLTGFYNRQTGKELVRHYLSEHEGTACAFIIVYLNDVKSINETLGHGNGDEALCLIAELIKQHFEEENILIRLGGDEFIVFIPGIATKEELIPYIEAFQEAVKTLTIADGKKKLSTSIGAALDIADAGECIERIYVHADKALARAKLEKDNYFVYNSQEKGLLELSTLDDVTGLLNRASTMDAINKYLAGDGEHGNHALLMLDLDNLKLVNDTLGHQAGDETLEKMGVCLRRIFDERDICGRIGGDEFFVFVKDAELGALVDKIKALLNDMQISYWKGSEQISTSVSIGIALYESDSGKTLRQLYSEADTALYSSKLRGKGTYTFAEKQEGIEFDAEDNLRKDLSSFNLKTLLDNLASGIAIYHGTLDEGLTPRLCNQKFLDLLGISYEEFSVNMSSAKLHGIHPDDYPEAMERLRYSAETGEPTRGTLRLRKGNGEYCNVLVMTNIRYLDDGSFDWYAVYSEFKEAEQLKLFQEARKRELQSKCRTFAEKNVAYAQLDLMDGRCLEIHMPEYIAVDTSSIKTAEQAIESIASIITPGEYRDDFLGKFSTEALLRQAEENSGSLYLDVPFYRKDKSDLWFKLRADLSLNPNTGKTEAFITAKNVDNEVRFGYMIDRLLETEYEFVAQIDVDSGYIIKLGSIDDGYFGEGRRQGGSYSKVVGESVKVLIPQEYWEECFEKFSLDTILSALESDDSYILTYPANPDRIRDARICRWKYEYVDKNRSIISMTRTNLSEALDYGYDSLTGMLNRNGFCHKLALELNSNRDCGYWLIEIDFVNFKQVNENRGYSAGNRLLRNFGADLRQSVKHLGRDCIVGHYEGDRFVVLLPDNRGMTPEDGYKELTTLVASYPEEFRLRIVMGVYKIDDKSLDAETMCDCAHLALMACKGRYGRYIRYYSDKLKDKSLEERMLVSEMQTALETQQFEVWIQPQVDHVAGGYPIGGEALVRWRHPTRGMISPVVYIPLFEHNGFIYELDKYIWRRSCQYLRKWLDEGLTPPPMSVNISRVDIVRTTFISTIVGIVEEYNIPKELLHLEITESAFSDAAEKIVSTVNELVSLGFIIAIDDFGSGYSSLGLLRNVPAHITKLDMSFFSSEDNKARNECIVESVIRMVKMLGMSVLAEGVETIEQAELLRRLGCSNIQGYLYSRPLPVEEYTEYFKTAMQKVKRRDELDIYHEEMEGLLLQSNELLHSVVSGTTEPLMIADVKTKELLYANYAAENFYGKRFDPINKISCMEFCGHAEVCDDCPANTLAPGERKEATVIRGDRHLKHFYSRLDWNGHDAFIAHQIDITTEIEELEFSNRLVRNIPAATVVFELDENSKPQIRYISDRTMEVFRQAGLQMESPSFEDSFSLIHPEDAERIRAAGEKTFREKLPFREEYRIKSENGGVLWIEMLINPVRDRDGSYLFYGVYTDITDRKNSQLRAYELLESIPAAITVYMVDGGRASRVFISDQARELLMSSDRRYDVVDQDRIYARVHSEDRDRVYEVTQKGFVSGKPFSIQFRLVGESGQIRWLDLNSTPIKLGTEQSGTYFYSVYTDITDQKMLEAGTEEQ